ncbi:MAG: competence protein ComEA [Flavobacteriales bacterium]|jgi:competence protein ComEA
MRSPDDTPFWQWFKDYLTFHSQEKTRIISFIGFILILMCIQLYLSLREPAKNLESIRFYGPEHFEKLNTQIESVDQTKPWKSKEKHNLKVMKELVAFNPNSLDSLGWRELGLSSKQAQVMVKIRNERQGFKSKQELAKINMLDHVYSEIEPFIQLPDTIARKKWVKTEYPNREFKFDSSKPKWPKKEFKKLHIDLNSADTLELIKLYGIGPSFARRIVKFKNSLGGFHSKKQLLDVWGMDSARYAGIKSEVFVTIDSIHKININTTTYEKLKNHPYIKYNVARSIVNYRQQHGPFRQVADLRRIHLIDQELLHKLNPYLSID